MITVASLFESQAEVTKALDALAESPFSEIEYRVYERSVAREGDEAQVIGLPMTEPSVGGSGPAVISSSAGTKLGDEELADFFRDAVETGSAVLVVAEVEDDRAQALENFFRDHGGRTAKDD
jgi:hypothetical protein